MTPPQGQFQHFQTERHARPRAATGEGSCKPAMAAGEQEEQRDWLDDIEGSEDDPLLVAETNMEIQGTPSKPLPSRTDFCCGGEATANNILAWVMLFLLILFLAGLAASFFTAVRDNVQETDVKVLEEELEPNHWFEGENWVPPEGDLAAWRTSAPSSNPPVAQVKQGEGKTRVNQGNVDGGGPKPIDSLVERDKARSSTGQKEKGIDKLDARKQPAQDHFQDGISVAVPGNSVAVPRPDQRYPQGQQRYPQGAMNQGPVTPPPSTLQELAPKPSGLSAPMSPSLRPATQQDRARAPDPTPGTSQR
eukprot:g13767.t1